jgi:hypothetical protein
LLTTEARWRLDLAVDGGMRISSNPLGNRSTCAMVARTPRLRRKSGVTASEISDDDGFVGLKAEHVGGIGSMIGAAQDHHLEVRLLGGPLLWVGGGEGPVALRQGGDDSHGLDLLRRGEG